MGIDPSCSAQASPDYSVAVDTSCAPNQYTKCSVTSGWVWGKTIRAYNDKDWFTFNVTEAGTYKFEVGNDEEDNGWSYGVTTSLRRADTSVIGDSNGKYSCYNMAFSCMHMRLPVGKYFVAVRMPLLQGTMQYGLLAYREGD